MIEVLDCGPVASVQDGGRPGHLATGLARGGAADRGALAEGAALLGGDGTEGIAGIETAGAPLTLRLHAAVTVALTGAPMRAEADGTALRWGASHPLPEGATLRLRPGPRGVYSYVTPRGGIATPPVMGSRAAQAPAGIGRPLATGDRLPVGAGGGAASLCLSRAPDRFEGGVLRCVPTPQTALFPAEAVARFLATAFRRDPRGDRRGVRLAHEGGGFVPEGGLSLLSDFVLPGDVQVTGDGAPYVLGPDCQTTGGYPRIATVIGADLPRAMQAAPGAALRFEMVDLAAARAVALPPPAVEPLVRDPATLRDLGARQLIGGVVDARAAMEER